MYSVAAQAGGGPVRLSDRQYNGVLPERSVPMIIEGPIRISAESSEDGRGFSLRLSFADEFQALKEVRQAEGFAAYLERLRTQSATLDAADPNRQGMLVVLQVGEQLLPMIEEGSLPLSEELEIGVEQQMPLASFLADSSGRLN